MVPRGSQTRMTDISTHASPSVVVFEADADNRNMCALYLEIQGARVRPVTTPNDVLARLHDVPPPDALVFDIVCLGMTVSSLCTAVQQMPSSRRPRLILVTGWLLSPSDRDTLRRHGVSIHERPCSLESLWAALRG